MRLLSDLGAAAVLACGWGCAAAPGPEPLDAARSEAEFRARTLEDAGLKRFSEANAAAPGTAFPPAQWDLRALTIAAFYYQPELDVARARLGQARAAGVTAGMWPNPVAAFDLEKVTNPTRGISPWVAGVSLSIPLDTLWKRGYRLEESERQGEAAVLALAETAWRVRSRVRAALAEHLVAARDLELREGEVGVRGEMLRALQRKLVLGDIFRLDVDVAEGELSSARLAIHTAQGRLAESLTMLAGALGVPPSAVRGRKFMWPDLEHPPSVEALALGGVQSAGLLNRMDLRGLLAEYAAAEAALKREVASRFPDVSLAPGFLYDQGDRKFTFGPTLTLPVLNQNEGPIAEADARRKDVAARFHQLQAAAIGEFESALDRYRTALAELGEAEATLASIGRREKSVQRAIDLKELDRTALAGLHLERVQAGSARLSSIKRAQDALGALEDAVEKPLTSESPLPEPAPRGPREDEKP
jgi:cobalt-zinc-cadmium efflux system outer membrane protein